MLWTIIGTFAALAGSIYPIPQLLRVIKDGHANGISRKFVIIWFTDKFLTLLLMIHLLNVPMICKYSVGLLIISLIGFYKFYIAPDKSALF